MYLTIAHLSHAPDALDPDAELLRPISGPGTEFLVVRRSVAPRVWLAPPHTSWLTAHFAFETAYPPRWREAAREAWLPVAFMNVIDVADGQSEPFEQAFLTRERTVDAQTRLSVTGGTATAQRALAHRPPRRAHAMSSSRAGRAPTRMPPGRAAPPFIRRTRANACPRPSSSAPAYSLITSSSRQC